MLKRFMRCEKGATAIEYSLIVAVLSLAIVAGVSRAGNGLIFLFSDSESELRAVFGD